MDAVTFRIGGQDLKVGPLPLWSLERCWPSIERLARPSGSPIERTRVYSEIIASRLMLDDETQTADALMKRITFPETEGIALGIVELLRISGFEATGNAPTGEAQATAPSTETGEGSSPSLSPTA